MIEAVLAGGAAASNLVGTVLTNQANARQAGRMMDFQERMSGTMHQREVADLKKAGLNPILSANSGGASSPAGAMGPMQAPQIDLPAIFQAKQLELDQQRVNNETARVGIEKQNSTAAIAKDLSQSQLNRAQELATKGGIGTKFLGTDVYEKLNKPIIPTIQKMFKQNPLQMKQPNSSGGSLP